jgi:branched-chain amino acid transport system ATP-binding protein
LYLEVNKLTLIYDRAVVLNEVSFRVDIGELVSLVGPNGAGKTSCLRAVAGLVKWDIDTLKGTTLGKITFEGSVIFNGEEIMKFPANEITKRGLTLCPERGRLFREMTVRENLAIGAYLSKNKMVICGNLEKVYSLFPILKQREKQVSGTLSGGERTMLSIGRALMSEAKLLLIDEPSTGLAPLLKQNLFERINDIHGMGITTLLVEQDISYAFDLAVRNYIMSKGKVVAEGTAIDLLKDELVRKTYLGL